MAVWLSNGTRIFAPHSGQIARLPIKIGLTLSLCPLGQLNLIPMESPSPQWPDKAVLTHLFPAADAQKCERLREFSIILSGQSLESWAPRGIPREPRPPRKNDLPGRFERDFRAPASRGSASPCIRGTAGK